MDALQLLLLDSRSPSGAHNHSSGMESAVGAGLVRALPDVEAFCLARLRTAGRLAADAAATACELHGSLVTSAGSDGERNADRWVALDRELDARTPSEATRAASHALGRGLLRLVRAMFPDVVMPPSTHHPIVLGAAVRVAGGTAELAARAAALGTVAVPASAAVRLLGLDPFAVHAMLSRLARRLDRGEFWPDGVSTDPREWAAGAVPVLDLLADYHLTTEVRLFAS